jgi:tripartite-type tricarboxylate transporter receptor subunit TctC
MDSINLNRRRVNSLLLATSMNLSWSAYAQTQSRIEMLRMLCGYPAGTTLDTMSRKLTHKLTGRYATNAIVENKPGAAGRIAIEEIKKAPNDGSVMLIAPASSMTLYPHVFQKLSYDVFNDFTPVSTVASTVFALGIGPKVPGAVTTVETFVQWCKSNPREAQCANSGMGSLPHFLAMLLAREAGIELAYIPYRGASMQAAASGELAAAIATEGTARPFHQAGTLRVLATTGSERSTLYPQAQTFRELGWNTLVQREWFGAFMPARTPGTVAQKAADAIRNALQEADIRELWGNMSWSPDSNTPAQLQAAIRREHDLWGPIVKTSEFTPES